MSMNHLLVPTCKFCCIMCTFRVKVWATKVAYAYLKARQLIIKYSYSCRMVECLIVAGTECTSGLIVAITSRTACVYVLIQKLRWSTTCKRQMCTLREVKLWLKSRLSVICERTECDSQENCVSLSLVLWALAMLHLSCTILMLFHSSKFNYFVKYVRIYVITAIYCSSLQKAWTPYSV